MEVLRPGDDACVAEDVEPTGTGTYTGSCSMELTVSSNGTYTCSATYTVNEDSTSPAGRANLDVLVTSKTRPVFVQCVMLTLSLLSLPCSPDSDPAD